MKSCYWRVNILQSKTACACERIMEMPNSNCLIMTHEVVQAGPGGDYCVVVGESILEQPEVNAPRLSLWSSHQPLGFRPEAGLIAIKRTHSEDGMHPYRSRGLQVSKRWLRPPLAPLPGVPWGLHISDGSRSWETISSRSVRHWVDLTQINFSAITDNRDAPICVPRRVMVVTWDMTQIIFSVITNKCFAPWGPLHAFAFTLDTLTCHALKSIGGSKSPGG